MAIEHLSNKYTIGDLRTRTGLKRGEFANRAGLSDHTIYKLEKGELVSARSAYRVLNTLNELLDMRLNLSDIEGLNLLP